VVLNWIRRDPNKWKTFVCKRIKGIQANNSPTLWRHYLGQENPADHLSRGLLGKQIQSLDIWWHGPSWLGKYEYWPSGSLQRTNHSQRRKKIPATLTATICASLIDAYKFSSCWKQVPTTAWSLLSCTTCGKGENCRRANGDETRCCPHV
jgi:hypothetical protein